MTALALIFLFVVCVALIGSAVTFRMIPPPPTFDISDEHIARIAHEANRAYCITQGDFSKRAWQNTEPHIRRGTIAGVRQLRINPKMSAEQLHAEWCQEREARGYRYGPVYCPIGRTHPNLVPYDQLSEAERFKDYLFRAIVTLAAPRG